MSNKLYRLVERFYRSAYGMHRFLENYLGLEMTLYSTKIPDHTVPSAQIARQEIEKYRQAYGPGFNATTLYSPVGTVRVMFPIYSVSREYEMTNELGNVRGYTFDNKIDIGDYLTTNIGSKKLGFKVIAKRTIGYSKQIVYVLDLSPVNVQDIEKIINRPV